MVAFLARPGRAQNLDAARLILEGMVRETGVAGARTRIEAARLLAWLPDAFEPQLRVLLADDNPDVARHAVIAVGTLRKRVLATDVIELLRDPLVVPDAVEALARFGDGIAGTLRDYLADPTIPREIRREIPELLLRLATPVAGYILVENLMERDTRIRFRIITALNKLLQAHPGRQFDRNLVASVLHAEILGLYRSHQVLAALQRHEAAPEVVMQALREAMAQETERVFRLLKLLYPQAENGVEPGSPRAAGAAARQRRQRRRARAACRHLGAGADSIRRGGPSRSHLHRRHVSAVVGGHRYRGAALDGPRGPAACVGEGREHAPARGGA
jgi:hypothetical protein